MGYNLRSRSLIGITSDGIVLGTNATRLPIAERWSSDGWNELRGVPWDLKPDRREAPDKSSDDVKPFVPMDPIPERPTQARAFYVKPYDIKNYQPTPGCAGCNNLKRGGLRSVKHNDECRERVVKCIETDNKVELKSISRGEKLMTR